MARESWKTVAIALAARIAYREGCARHGTVEDGAAEMCPFCEDAAVYRRFTRRLAQDGQRIRNPLEGARSVPLRELLREEGTP